MMRTPIRCPLFSESPILSNTLSLQATIQYSRGCTICCSTCSCFTAHNSLSMLHEARMLSYNRGSQNVSAKTCGYKIVKEVAEGCIKPKAMKQDCGFGLPESRELDLQHQLPHNTEDPFHKE